MAWNQEYATQYGLSTGLLNPGETATGGLLQQRANAAGVDLVPVMQAANQPAPIADNFSGGVVPLNVVPMNQWEQTALTKAAQGINPAQVQRDPYAEQFLSGISGLANQATTMAQNAASPITAADIQKFQDPYEEQVIQNAMGDLSSQAQDVYAQLLKNAGTKGAASFGSTMTQRPLSQLNEDTIKASGDLSARLRSQGYGQALGAAFDERGLMGRGATTIGQLAGQMGGLAAGAQNIGLSAAGLQQANIADQLQAGQTLRDFQQGQSDVAYGDLLAEQGFPMTRATQLANFVPSLAGNVQNVPYFQPSGTATTLGKIAAGANVLGSFL